MEVLQHTAGAVRLTQWLNICCVFLSFPSQFSRGSVVQAKSSPDQKWFLIVILLINFDIFHVCELQKESTPPCSILHSSPPNDFVVLLGRCSERSQKEHYSVLIPTAKQWEKSYCQAEWEGAFKVPSCLTSFVEFQLQADSKQETCSAVFF